MSTKKIIFGIVFPIVISIIIIAIMLILVIKGLGFMPVSDKQFGEKVIAQLEEKYNKDFTLVSVSVDQRAHVNYDGCPEFAFIAGDGYDEFINEYHNYLFSRKVDDFLDKHSFTHVDAYSYVDDMDLALSEEEYYKDTGLISLVIVTTEELTMDDAKKIFDEFSWLKEHNKSRIVAMHDIYSTDKYDSLGKYGEYLSQSAINYTTSPYTTFDHHYRKFFTYYTDTNEIVEEED